jgi:hypothetical protein
VRLKSHVSALTAMHYNRIRLNEPDSSDAGLEEVMRPWETVFLVEAKNWSTRVSASELDSLIAKLRRRHLKTGILVATNGVTGTFQQGDGRELGAVQIMRGALQDGFRVIVITFADLRAIETLDHLRALIKHKYCGLFVNKIL